MVCRVGARARAAITAFLLFAPRVLVPTFFWYLFVLYCCRCLYLRMFLCCGRLGPEVIWDLYYEYGSRAITINY